MRKLLTKLFWPILSLFETSETAGAYKKSHRFALLGVGCLFGVLSVIALIAKFSTGDSGALVPFAIFFVASLVSLVVATLGSDAAVSKIWGNKRDK